MSRPRLKKSLGQHHLVDGSLCRPLVEYLAPKGRHVVEIGPGGGVLTYELLTAGGRITAVELDRDWAFSLGPPLAARAATEGAPRPRLLIADALQIDWSRMPAGTLVAGNLPYNVATAILQRLLAHHGQIERIAVLVQREVAERLAAAPGGGAYGALSVLVQARSRVRLLGRVRPGSFRPPPKVDSSFVGLELVEPPRPDPEMPHFEKVVRLAFASRRKTLANSLSTGWPKPFAREALTAAGIDPGRRAEELPLAAFLALHDAALELSNG